MGKGRHSVRRGRRWAPLGVAMASLALAGVLGAPSTSEAAPTPEPPFTQCPAIGQDSSCGLLITINADGTVSAQGDSTQGPYDGTDDTLVGVQNNAEGYVSSIALSGSDIFGFDGDGICTYAAGGIAGSAGFTGDGYCTAAQLDGTDPEDYQGPDNTFTVTDDNDGSVDFDGAGLAPGASTYFSLESTPTPGSITLTPVIVGTPASVTGTEGSPITPATVATFSDADATLGASDFAASIDWGDGTPPTAGTVSGPTGGPYTVTGGHTYTEEGSYDVDVTVTDLNLTANTVTIDSSAAIADAALHGTGVDFDATAGTSTGAIAVATFTDANPYGTASDFTASVNWGDGTPTTAGTVTGPTGGPFTVTASHTYAVANTYPVTVDISDVGGATTTAEGQATVGTAVISCPAGQSCSGTASVPNSMSVTVSGTSTTNGKIIVQVGVGTLSCGDPFFHAPEVTTQTEQGFTSTSDKIVTLDINKKVVAGRFFLLFQVCYSGNTPFTDAVGHRNVTTGVLPYCILVRNQAPCTISTTLSRAGDVVETFAVPPGDPEYH